jgi:hypothetical protein
MDEFWQGIWRHPKTRLAMTARERKACHAMAKGAGLLVDYG